MKTVMLVFGTRPEAIKMCPLVNELKTRKTIRTVVCVTGQHRQMLDQVLEAFQTVPDYDLSIMKTGQTLFDVTTNILNRIGTVLDEVKPDVVLVHGDTSTTFVTALACFYKQIPVGHVEAGLRTYNIYSPYPEEFNRQAVSIISAYNFAPTELARQNLLKEGKKAETIWVTGNDGHIYLSVVPDKGSFTEPTEGYTPASAQETADALLAQLDFVQYVDIAPGLTLEDYYRTDPHWRQECLISTAQTLAQAMDVPLASDFQENAVDTPFFGSYAGKTDEPLTADTLRYLIGGTLDACTVYDYETEAQEGLYDLSAVDTKTPYDLYLQGSKSLLRIDSPLSATDKTLVVFRDSFGSSLIPLLSESYRTIYAVDIRYLSSQMVGRFLSFDGSEDVLFLYSTMVLQNSRTMK